MSNPALSSGLPKRMATIVLALALALSGALIMTLKHVWRQPGKNIVAAAIASRSSIERSDTEAPDNMGWRASFVRALHRARWAIGSIALTYVLALLTGVTAVHLGQPWALQYRDRIVAQGRTSDPAGRAMRAGAPVKAAFLDASRNLFVGAVPDTVSGLALVFPYLYACHRGWVGGIVSVTQDRSSRLNKWPQALYYVSVVLFQLLPYSLAGGMGVYLGLAVFSPQPLYAGARWLGFLPPEAVFDVLRVYCVIPPMFLAASLWEYLSPWNV